MIQFQCLSCQVVLNAPDNFAGQFKRCKQCHSTIQIPCIELSSSVETVAIEQKAVRKMETEGVSFFSPAKIIVGGFVLLLLLTCFLTFALYKGNVRDQAVQDFHALVESTIPFAKRHVHKYEFKKGLGALEDLLEDINTSQYASFLDDDKMQIQKAMRDIKNNEKAHKLKITQGWSFFEGEFISKQDKDSILILTARKKVRQRQLAEARKRAAEKKRKEEELRKIAEADKKIWETCKHLDRKGRFRKGDWKSKNWGDTIRH